MSTDQTTLYRVTREPSPSRLIEIEFAYDAMDSHSTASAIHERVCFSRSECDGRSEWDPRNLPVCWRPSDISETISALPGGQAKRFVISWFLIICFDANGSI